MRGEKARPEERYNSFSAWLKARFGRRVAKISLDAGLSCPNRDGTISRKGCVFCDVAGSGTGAWARGVSIPEQIRQGRERLSARYKADLFIAYFQAFSNTHAPAERLREIYEPTLAFDDLVALSIATRPDCLDEPRLDLLAELNQRKEIWLELGLQSAHDETLRRINRGHDLRAFVRAAEGAAARRLTVFVHLILGLPGEGLDQARETVRRLAPLKLAGVKFHGLYVSSDAPLAAEFRAGRVRLLGLEEYADWISDLIPRLPADWVLQRLTADPNPKTLLGPEWMLRKPQALAAIHRRLEERDVRQGRLFRA